MYFLLKLGICNIQSLCDRLPFKGVWTSQFFTIFQGCTPPKFNIAPGNQWLEDEFPFGMAYFQGLR